MPFKIGRIVTTKDANGKAVVGADDALEAKPGVMTKAAMCWQIEAISPAA